MKISEIFKLNKSQHELDFVDIDVDKDKPLFLDPYFLSARPDPWSVNASRTVKNFFQYVIDLMKSGDEKGARALFEHLNEPNETCLGVSRDMPQGRGVGVDNAESIFESLKSSKAVETGLVEDIEDSAIFVEKIGKDKISDMTTNIIRRHLLDYTLAQCKMWDIPVTSSVPSGYYWDPVNKVWDNSMTEVLIIEGRRILLVPKSVVSFYKAYIDQQYFQHYVLNYLQNEHLKFNTHLVRRDERKDGTIREYVTKKDLEGSEDVERSKEFLRDFTEKHPEVFKEFRDKTKAALTSVTNEQISRSDIKEVAGYLIQKLKQTPKGISNAHEYHKLMVGVLELIFYPNLTNPIKEKETNEGLKRIDVTFDNAAKGGIFHTLHSKHNIPCPYIMVECKNYGSDIGNPELDQMIGRLSPNKGKVGLIVCRDIQDKESLSKRCNYTRLEDKGLIIVLTDKEIIEILTGIIDGVSRPEEKILSDIVRDTHFN